MSGFVAAIREALALCLLASSGIISIYLFVHLLAAPGLFSSWKRAEEKDG